MKVGDKYVIEIEEVIRRNGAPQIAEVLAELRGEE